MRRFVAPEGGGWGDENFCCHPFFHSVILSEAKDLFFFAVILSDSEESRENSETVQNILSLNIIPQHIAFAGQQPAFADFGAIFDYTVSQST